MTIMSTKKLFRLNELLSGALLWLAGLALLGMVLLAVANMVLRPFGYPIRGTYELVGFLGALVIALGLGSSENKKYHESVALITRHFPAWLNRGLDMMAQILSAVFFGLMAWSTAVWAWSLLESGELSETLRFNYVVFPLSVALGLAAMSLALLCSLLALFLPAKKQLPIEITKDGE